MLIQAVLTYIAEKQTDYALMINGEWGSGKSFFITNDLRTAITKAYPKIKLVHVSLNGLESLEEIYQKILAEVIGDSRAFTRIGFGFLKTIMDLDIEIPKIGLKAKNIAKVLKDSSLVVARETSASPDMVLCFDDLERISSSLEIQSVLGYIHSNFIEFKNMKVLLVCDESKIDQMKYAVIKEKVIGRTHLFRLDIAEIFLSLVRAASTDEVFLRAMEREGPALVKFLQDRKIKNLRTIKFILNILKVVLNANPTFSENMFHRIAYSVACIAIEYKAGTLPRDVSLTDFTEIGLIRAMRRQNRTDKDPPEVLSYEETFYDKYVGKLESEYLGLQSIYDFVMEGSFDPEQFARDLMPYTTSAQPPQNAALEEIINFRDLEQDQLATGVEKVIGHVKAGDFSLHQFMQAALFLAIFYKRGMISTDPAPILREGAEFLMNKLGTSSLGLSDQFHSFRDSNNPPIVTELMQFISERVERNRNQQREEKISEFFKLLFAGDDTALKLYHNSFEHESIFVQIKLGDLKALIDSASNKGIHLFTQFLHYRYIRISNIRDLHAVEIPVFTELLEYLNSKNTDGLPGFVLIEARNRVQEVIAHLRPLIAPGQTTG